MHADSCLVQNVGRRRIFWTTHPQACGDYAMCGVICSIPGLVYEEGADDGRTIATDGWLTSLVLNILNTRSRTDVKCPAPSAVFGHWSESYRDDGLYVGSTLWNAAAKSYVRIADNVKAIISAIRADMAKLIALGIATGVDVEGTYVAAGRVNVTVTITTTTGPSRIDLSGSLVSETWVWQ
jgi:phage gp46-like protein